jgi:hypothetical protein
MAKVCTPETRVLCEHSAAWIAVLVLDAGGGVSLRSGGRNGRCGRTGLRRYWELDDVPEQPGYDGYLPLVFDVAGSRVARIAVADVRMMRMLDVRNILIAIEAVESSSEWTMIW